MATPTYLGIERQMESLSSWFPSAMPFFPHLILGYKQASCVLWKLSLDVIWVTWVVLLPGHTCACAVYTLSPSNHGIGLVPCCGWCWGMFGFQAPHFYFAWGSQGCFGNCSPSWAAFERGIRQEKRRKPQQRKSFSLGSKDRVFSEVNMQHPLIGVEFFRDRINLMWLWAPKWG